MRLNRHQQRSPLILACLYTVCVASMLSGCAAEPDLTGPIVDTPIYSENKLFYLETLRIPKEDYEGLRPPNPGNNNDPEPETVEGDYGFVAPQFSAPTQLLQHPYEWVTDFDEREIKPKEPISVVLKSVRVPEDLAGKRDIAIILDISATPGNSTESMVVYYQRGVPGGQMLNFSELLVFSQKEWDGSPPYFRVRVVDVNAEKRSRARAFLDQVDDLGGALGGVMPHPVLPIVNVAIQTAGLVLNNPGNRIILDFQVQMYPLTTNSESGGELTALRSGSWVVLGRPRAQLAMLIQKRPVNVPTLLLPGRQRPLPYIDAYRTPSDTTRYEQDRIAPHAGVDSLPDSVPTTDQVTGFDPTPSDIWRENFVLDRRTGQVLRWEDSQLIQSPYLMLTISKSHHGVSKEVLDRTSELLDRLQLSGDGTGAASQRLKDAIMALQTAVNKNSKNVDSSNGSGTDPR